MYKVFESIECGINEVIEHAHGQPVGRSVKVTVKPVGSYDAQTIKSIRQKTGMSQKMFAASLGVSSKTIEAWERGRNQPEGAARRLLEIVDSDPQILERFRDFEP